MKEEINEYKVACAEVLEIIDNISYDDYLKIPKNVIQNLIDSADKNIDFTYDPSLTLDEQNVSETAKAIISTFYRDYWASTYQRQRIKAKEQYDIEKLLKDKYNPDDIFKNRNRVIPQEEQTSENTKMIIVQEEKWYQKIFNLINNLFHRNKME